MGKIIECAKVDPTSGCKHVVRGKDEEEVLKNDAGAQGESEGRDPGREVRELLCSNVTV